MTSSPNTKKPKITICVGAAKAGTSSLHALLEQHPAIAVTSPKETDFFIEDQLVAKGADYYLQRYYSPTESTKIYFESDPIYMYKEGAIENIASLFPDAYIIVMLRQPVRRAFSQYLYRMDYGRYAESFEEMCNLEFKRVSKSIEAKLEYGCLDRSMYAQQIKRILKHFPAEKVHFIIFEDFIKNQQTAVDKLLPWLGLEATTLKHVVENEGGRSKSLLLAQLLFHQKYRSIRKSLGILFPSSIRRWLYAAAGKLNKRAYRKAEKPQLNPTTFKNLMPLFETDIEELQQMTGLNLEHWKF